MMQVLSFWRSLDMSSEMENSLSLQSTTDHIRSMSSLRKPDFDVWHDMGMLVGFHLQARGI